MKWRREGALPPGLVDHSERASGRRSKASSRETDMGTNSAPQTPLSSSSLLHSTKLNLILVNSNTQSLPQTVSQALALNPPPSQHPPPHPLPHSPRELHSSPLHSHHDLNSQLLLPLVAKQEVSSTSQTTEETPAREVVSKGLAQQNRRKRERERKTVPSPLQSP